MKVNAIIVTEYADDEVVGLHAFSDDEDGIKEAKECFEKVVKENGDNVTDEELKEFVQIGEFEQGTYQAFLKHSN